MGNLHSGSARGAALSLLGAALVSALPFACSSSSGDTSGSPSPDGGTGDVSGSGGAAGSGAGGENTAGSSASGGGGSSGAGGTAGTSGGGAGGACVPVCAGHACGDDGCQGSCGTCPTGTACDGTGRCVPASCPAGCTADCLQGCFDLGDCATTNGATLELTANVYTLGVVETPGGAGGPAELYYRVKGSATWSRGTDLASLPDGRWASSAFSLPPATEIEVMVRDASGKACGSATTQVATPSSAAAEEFWVQAGATGGDGTSEKPFGTISEAVAAATPSAGTDVHVKAGVYREEVVIQKSGTSGHYLRILGEPGAILDGSSASPPATWTDAGNGVYTAPWPGDPRYVTRDASRLYHYETLADLNGGLGHGGEPIEEGFIVDSGTLYVRSKDAPAGHAFHIPAANTALEISGAGFVWVEGLEIRYYGEGDYAKGVDVTDTSHDVVVRKNDIHDIPSTLWVRKGSHALRIEDNVIRQSNDFSWPWTTTKATDHENDAITLAGGRGAIVARNVISDVFNGVYAGSFDDDHDPALAYDIDVYENRLTRIGDDGFEPEGADVNARFWGNVVDSVHNGLSLAPITYGPVWGVRNRFSSYQESGFKVSNDTSGRVFLFHNTCYTDFPDHNGMNVSGAFDNIVFRNNVIRGTSYAIESTQTGLTDDLDYDALYTTRGAPRIKWNDVRYDDLPALCAATNLECHGQGGDPALVAPGSFQFSPGSGSPLVDHGLRLYGINDAYAGAAPDIGYVEAGTAELPPVP
ncbi:MAG TPA: hypothetical protein VHE30_05180 [Polyangiaceae bacterium]|nr:hypothetical protein [Polyangiaceae bacterium]